MTAPIFGQPLPKVTKGRHGATKEGTNPMLAYGKGPEGRTCKTCAHIRVNRFGKNYYKCAKRGMSASAATDHRLKWPACAYYQENVEGEE